MSAASVGLLALGLTLGQSPSTAPVDGPSPGYSVSAAPASHLVKSSHQAAGVVRKILPSDPSSAGQRKVVVVDQAGTEFTFKLDRSTMIRMDGANLSPASVQPGQEVQVSYTTPSGDDGTFPATFVVVTSRAKPVHPAGAPPPRVPIARKN